MEKYPYFQRENDIESHSRSLTTMLFQGNNIIIIIMTPLHCTISKIGLPCEWLPVTCKIYVTYDFVFVDKCIVAINTCCIFSKMWDLERSEIAQMTFTITQKQTQHRCLIDLLLLLLCFRYITRCSLLRSLHDITQILLVKYHSRNNTTTTTTTTVLWPIVEISHALFSIIVIGFVRDISCIFETQALEQFLAQIAEMIFKGHLRSSTM